MHNVVQRETSVAKPRENAHRGAALHMSGALYSLYVVVTFQMAGLRRHMAIHTGEKRYNCSFCNKKFTQSHHLQNHMITHTGDRPYTCEVSRFNLIVTCKQTTYYTTVSVYCGWSPVQRNAIYTTLTNFFAYISTTLGLSTFSFDIKQFIRKVLY